MIKQDGQYIDANNNKWNAYIYTEHEAAALSKTLVNCRDCKDCNCCKDCNYCFKCSNCKECNDCNHFFDNKKEMK